MADLKHYDIYIALLKRLARTLRIKVIIKNDKDDAWWSPKKRIIKIDSDLSESDTIAALLHELGHSFDDTLTSAKSIERAYINYYEGLHTKKQWQLVINREKAAWRFARLIAKMSGIRLGKWFYRYESQCLGGYKF